MKLILIGLLIASNAFAYDGDDERDNLDSFYRTYYSLTRYSANNYIPGNPFFYPIYGEVPQSLFNMFRGFGVNCQTMSKPNGEGITFSVIICR